MSNKKNKKVKGTRIGSNFLYIGLLISVLFNITALYNIRKIQEEMDFNHRWMIIKRIRAELIEARLKVIEKKLNIKYQP
jgi:hypothetical protein